MRSILACVSGLVIMTLAGACESGADPVAVPCAVTGGACAPGELCAHVCDCCGIPPDVDAGIVPSGHDTCVPDTGQCSGRFAVEGRDCMCRSDGQADCPCA